MIEGNDLQIEEHILNKNLGEIKQPNLILPLIIKDDQVNFESLKKLTVPTLSIPKLQSSRESKLINKFRNENSRGMRVPRRGRQARPINFG